MKRAMTREDAQALLDVMRLDRSPLPPLDEERMMRRYVEIVSNSPPETRRVRGDDDEHRSREQ
jgi:hypothetical protein